MFIDNVIAVEGIENFSFELLKEVEHKELNYWEDYFILKFNTYFPNGYNRRWNCSEEIRNSLKIKVQNDLQEEKVKEQPKSIYTEEEILYLFNDEMFYQYCLIYFLFVYKKDDKYYAKNRDITSRNLENYSNIKYNTVNKYKNVLKQDKLLIKQEYLTEFCYIPDILKYLTKEEILLAGKDTIFLWYIKKKVSETN